MYMAFILLLCNILLNVQMEKEQNALVISELTRGRELVKQLRRQLDSLTLPEKCDLLHKLLSCYDKALTILNWKLDPRAPECADRDSSLKDQCHRQRKRSRQSGQQIRVCASCTFPLDDGHTWRKYGQKQILGANHPRAYYRCSHRNTQGCLATKRVQKSDEDPSVFEVTYKGKHSCSNTTQFQVQQAEELAFNFGQPQKLQILVPSIKSQDAEIKETDLAPFMSPTSSESMYLSSLLGQNDDYDLGLSHILLNTEPDLTQQLVSTPTSVTDWPFSDYNLPTDPTEFWS